MPATDVCALQDVSEGACEGGDRLKRPETWALAVFMASFMLVGIGASPVYTLGPTYLYDNVKAGSYPVYSGKCDVIGGGGVIRESCPKASGFIYCGFNASATARVIHG